MLRRLGRDRYAAALGEHRKMLRATFARFSGVEVEMQGDSFHFAFAYARDAVAAAAAAQRAFAAHDWEDEPIRVRIGLHTGEPVIRDSLYAGLDVHRAARVMEAASGGQVLLSARTADLVQGELPPDLKLLPLGRYLLKDFELPEALTQLCLDGLDNQFAVRAPVAHEDHPDDSSATRPRARRESRILLGALALVATAAIAGAVLLPDQGSAPQAHDVAVAIDPKTNGVVHRTPVGGAPNRIAVGEGGVWVVNSADATLSKLDPASERVVRTIGTEGTPADVAVGGGSVWLLDQPTLLLRIDPTHVETGGTLRIGSPRSALLHVAYLTYDSGSVWASSREQLARVDTRRLALARLTRIHDIGPVAIGGGHV